MASIFLSHSAIAWSASGFGATASGAAALRRAILPAASPLSDHFADVGKVIPALPAKRAMTEAASAAEKLASKSAARDIFDDLSQSEARLLDTQARKKQDELGRVEEAAKPQQELLSALEKRLDDLISKARSGTQINVDTAQGQGALDQLKASLESLPEQKTVTVNIVENKSGNVADSGAGNEGGTGGAATPRFAAGGYTGNLPISSIAGVVHGQEEVIRAAMVRQPGARQFLELFNRVGMSALPLWLKGVKLPGYKDDGYVAPRGKSGNLVPTVFNFPNIGNAPVQVSRPVAEDLARILKVEALMRGKH
jgi:hypothetical protein